MILEQYRCMTYSLIVGLPILMWQKSNIKLSIILELNLPGIYSFVVGFCILQSGSSLILNEIKYVNRMFI
jgi:hypothetical protein